jgi:hypothetical protein
MAFGAAAVLTVVAAPDQAQAQNGPYQFYAITPCRLVDTRSSNVTVPHTTVGESNPCPGLGGCNGNNATKLQGPLPATPRTNANRFKVSLWPAQGLCGVPVGAKAIAANLTVVGPSGAGDMAMFPAGATPETTTMPQVSALNFAALEPALANGAIVPLGASGSSDLALGTYILQSGAAAGTAHAIIDVTGYFQ